MQSQPFIFSTSFTDFEGLRGQLKGVDMEMIPLRSGSFSGHTDVLVDDSFVFTHGVFNSDHRYRGTSHPSHVLLGIHFGEHGTAHFGSNVGKQGDLSVLQPGQEHFGSMGGTFEYAALSIEGEELARLGVADGLVNGDGLLRRNGQIRAPARVSAEACNAVARLSKVAFDLANTRSASRLGLFKRSLLYPYLLVAAHGHSEPDGLALESKENIVRRAEYWLDSEPLERLHVIDLCLALGLPLRTVQRAFCETLGVGPAHYLIYYRLHKVRQTLLSCNPTDTRITDVALDHGFWELGRFAGLYRKTYGERPSETLRRRQALTTQI